MTSVYIIGRELGPVKIGVSNDPARRLAALQGACPFKIELIHERSFVDRNEAYRQERTFHRVFRAHRTSGEWFDLDAERAIDGLEVEVSTLIYFEDRHKQENLS